MSLAPKYESRLGPRGLHRSASSRDPSESEHSFLWVLNKSDGDLDLLSITERSRINSTMGAGGAGALRDAGLLEAVA